MFAHRLPDAVTKAGRVGAARPYAQGTQRKNTCARLDDLIRLFLLASSAALGLSLLAGGLNHLFSDLLSSLPAASFPSV